MKEIYRMWDESEPTPKNPAVSKALEQLEERLIKQQEMAEMRTGATKSRARSKMPRHQACSIWNKPARRLLHPLCVEELANWLVRTLISVSSEEVALSLQEVRR